MAPENKKNGISQAVTWRKAGEEAVILNLETSEYFSANETGTFIWELLSAGKDPEKIAAELAAGYGLTAEQAAEDTRDFLKDLARLGIITRGMK